ncbi:MAG: D-alanyl-D-alanine carboxypeptidase [Fimbriimonadales bacterium]|nr:D-alanyl-D-alanine carboxypeptidase [Fimbriimonadales bacterium]
MEAKLAAMRWFLLVALVLSASWLWADAPTVQARSAILVEASTGQVLFGKNPDLPLPPASLTKMMTALLVLERCGLEEQVTASKRAVDAKASTMHLQEGEQVSVRDLLYALLLRSANDAATALAEHAAGSVESFVQLMNEKARELGATRTHFTNPHGLHDPRHRSTARDLALIARYAMENPQFRAIVRQREAVIARSIKQDETLMVSKAKFLELYPWAEGIKTGFTRQAGFCFAGAASKEGRRLIAVVLNSPQREQDTIALMEYGFNEWQPVVLGQRGQSVGLARVKNGVQEQTPVQLAQPAIWVVPRRETSRYRWVLMPLELQAPVPRGTPAGWAVLQREGQPVIKVPLQTAQAVEARASAYTGILWGGSLTLLAYALHRHHAQRKRKRFVTNG